jgi:hypothetical protein
MYKNKYLKYKNKYLEIKNNYSGGMLKTSTKPNKKTPKKILPEKISQKIYTILNIPKEIINTRKYELSDLCNNIIINVNQTYCEHIQNSTFSNPLDFISNQIPKEIFNNNKDLSKYEIINNVTDTELYMYVIFKLLGFIKTETETKTETEIPLLKLDNINSVILNINIMSKYKKYLKDFIKHQLYTSIENNIIINSKVDNKIDIEPTIIQNNNKILKELNVDLIRDEIFKDINLLLSNIKNKVKTFKFGKELSKDEKIISQLRFVTTASASVALSPNRCHPLWPIFSDPDPQSL